MAIGLVPIARRAIMSARYGAPFTIEMLMTIAAVGAVAIGAVEEAAVGLLFLVGELLDVAAGRACAASGPSPTSSRKPRTWSATVACRVLPNDLPSAM